MKINVIYFNGLNYTCGNFISCNVEKAIKKVNKDATFTDMKWIYDMFGNQQKEINEKFKPHLFRKIAMDFISDQTLYLNQHNENKEKIAEKMFKLIKKGQHNILIGFNAGALMLIDSLLLIYKNKCNCKNKYIKKIVFYGTPLLQCNYQKKVEAVENIHRDKVFTYWNRYDWLSTPSHFNPRKNDIPFDPSPWYLYFLKKTPMSHFFWFFPNVKNNFNSLYREILNTPNFL